MGSEGSDYRPWLDFWCADMVVVCDSIGDQHGFDMGVKSEIIAYVGRFQYPMDMVELYGISATSHINTFMKYLLPMARNLSTGQTVKTQDLTGTRLTLQQRQIAEALSRQLADKMTARTGDSWVGFTKEYTPSIRR